MTADYICHQEFINKDEETREEIRGYEITAIKGLPKTQRYEIIRRIKEIERLTQRQV